jgi:hypothetical protein
MVLDYVLDCEVSQIKEKLLELITDQYDLFIEWVASGGVAVFISDFNNKL